LLPDALQWKRLELDQLELSFGLTTGGYATVVLREIAELFRPQIQAL
jgi:tRNA pseudouridine13 synthase